MVEGLGVLLVGSSEVETSVVVDGKGVLLLGSSEVEASVVADLVGP